MTRNGGDYSNVTMKIRADPGNKSPGERLFGLFTPLGAKPHVVIDGIPKGFAQFRNGRSLKSDNVPGIDDLPVKYFGLVVIFNVSDETFVFHHDVRPASVRKRRIDRKAPLSVSFR